MRRVKESSSADQLTIHSQEGVFSVTWPIVFRTWPADYALLQIGLGRGEIRDCKNIGMPNMACAPLLIDLRTFRLQRELRVLLTLYNGII